ELMNRAYQVKLDAFEGPLEVWLHLINRYEVDIYDVPVATITEQNLHYIHTMQRLELNVGSESMVMAAVLSVITRQMLLTKQDVTGKCDTQTEDHRGELMQRLIEYRKYKEVAQQLKEKENHATHTFTRPPLELEHDHPEVSPVVKANISIYDMLAALDKVFERKKWNEPTETRIKRAELSIEHRMQEVLQLIKGVKSGISFDELFTYNTR